MDHLLIKAIKIGEEVVRVIHKIPLTSSILITPSIPLTREVNPLGMAELISHEVQVSTIDSGCCDEAYHLMQRDTAVRHEGRMTVLEMPVHIGVHETEDDGLIAHERLVMTLRIRYGFLILTTVRHFKQDMTGFPVLILHLFDILNPEIRNTHCQTIVETYTAIGYRTCQARHTAHLLRNRDGIGFHFVDHLIGQRQIHQGITIFVSVEVRRIAVEVFAQTVRAIDHRSHTIETESVEVVFVEPELTVREQEMQHFVLAVVEAETIPSRVLTTGTVMEILITRTIEVTETLEFVLHRMAMHEVHDDMHTSAVSIVDEGFEFIRRTEATAGRKEIRYMVSEGAVVRVLLDSHDLHAVITQLIDTRQHITTELLVRIHFLLFGTHADMALVDIERFARFLICDF